MEQHNDLPRIRFFREERKFLSDYRQRAFWIGVVQLCLSVCCFPAVLLLSRLIETSPWKSTFKYVIESENRTLGKLDIAFQNPALDLAHSELYFWMTCNLSRALLHIFSSVLIMHATSKGTTKFRALRICKWIRRMNLAFLLYEIVVHVFMYQEWGCAFYFILYRFWFNYEIGGFSNLVKMSPPGR